MNEIELKLSEQAFQWIGKDTGHKTGFRLTDPTRSDVPEVVIMYEPKGNRFVKIPFGATRSQVLHLLAALGMGGKSCPKN